jgi:enamine deaminase RidA (YjgF/YER057c/UK114 family)
VAAYVPAVRSGNLLFISGQLPGKDGQLLSTGPVPSVASVELATAAARQCAINILAVAKQELGELSRITRVVRLGVFVASDSEFSGQPAVANGASELFQTVLGPKGTHARAAVGTNVLPRNATVEIDAILEVE